MFVVVQRMGLLAGSKMFVVVQRMGLLAMAVRCLLLAKERVCWL